MLNINLRLDLPPGELEAIKTKLRSAFGASLDRLEWSELGPGPQPAQGLAKPPVLRPLDPLAETLRVFGVTLPLNYAKWKLTWRSLSPAPTGHVIGLSTLRGQLVATDGVKAILVREDGAWSYIHIDSFLIDKTSPAQLEGAGAAANAAKTTKPRRSALEVALEEYV